MLRQPACFAVLGIALGMVAAGSSLFAQSPSNTEPLSGDALQRKLSETIGVSWSRVALGDVVASLTRNTHVCIWLDRRVDRQRLVEWSSRERTLRETIEQLAAQYDLGVAWVGSVAYLAPKSVATALPTLLARRNTEIAALPPNVRAVFAERRPLAWDDLAEPKELLTQVAAQAKWSIDVASVPHDLWPHLETPPLTLAERLSLLTAGFELTYQLNPATSKILLGPWPADLVAAATPATPAPKTTATPTGAKNPVAPPAAAAPELQRYTLRVQGVPLSKLIDVLKQRHGLKIRTDDQAIVAAGLTLEKATSVDVQQATLEALLQQAAAPLKLQARQDGDTVVIEPKK